MPKTDAEQPIDMKITVGKLVELKKGKRKRTRKLGVLSSREILRYYQKGRISILPFSETSIQPNSYDVRLGEFFYQERKKRDTSERPNFYNMHTPGARMWEELPNRGYRLIDWIVRSKKIDRLVQGRNITYAALYKAICLWAEIEFTGVRLLDRIMILGPGETILGHTEEFIGGLDGVTTMLKTRSSYGRSNIGICKCAGWGDTGFINRWTLEITNFAKNHGVMLVCGRRVGQIVFFRTGETLETYRGKYQDANQTAEQLVEKWHPSQMLPNLDNDIECAKSLEEQCAGVSGEYFTELCKKQQIELK